MATVRCEKCGFPTVELMSSKPNSTEQVRGCLSCGSEQPIAEGTNLHHMIDKTQIREECTDKEIVTLISDFCCLDKSIITVKC